MRLNELGRRLVIQPDRNPYDNISIIGCGGIGARILPALVKMLDRRTTIYLWDHDVVEVKNLLRQNFTLPDVGKPKAEVLADRYRSTLAHTVAKVMRWEEHTHGVPDGIVISAVDDWATRKALMGGYGTVIDCGNDGLRGQVLLGGYLDGWKLSTIDRFPELVTAPTEAQRLAISCEMGDTQTVVANTMAASLALVYVEALKQGHAFSHLGMMYSLPHGVWEIPVAQIIETWRGQTMSEQLTVYPGWLKSSANWWQPPLDGKGVWAVNLAPDGPWTDRKTELVEQKLNQLGAERGCRCENCLPLITGGLAELGYTEVPEEMQDRWGKLTDPTEEVQRRYTQGHRSRSRTCSQCGETYRLGVSMDLGTDDAYEFCSPVCNENYNEENPPDTNDEVDDEEEQEPEPEPDEDENIAPEPEEVG